jgi:DNA-binding winged helix-turn-helix (wHTH) protein/Tol biopolymer transport system component
MLSGSRKDVDGFAPVMAPASKASPASIVAFGEFLFDPVAQELYKRNFRIRVPASRLRLLTLFLERPGELISRDEVRDRLWKETGTIDVDRGINTAINNLRATLDDKPDQPRFLETVIGMGYRFIAPVVAQASSEPEPACAVSDTFIEYAPQLPAEAPAIFAVHEPRQAKPAASTRRSSLAVLSAFVLLSVALLGWWHWRKTPQLAHDAPGQTEFQPATFDHGSNEVAASALSPDGTRLAYADEVGISIHTFNGDADKLLNSEPGVRTNHLAWLHNDMLVASGVDAPSGDRQVWLVGPSSYNLLDLKDASQAEPSPDGSHLAFMRNGGREIWVATVHGDDQRILQPATKQAAFQFMLWSRDGTYLLLSGYDEQQPGRAPGKPPPPADWFYETVDAHNGRVLSRTEGLQIESGFLAQDGTLHYVNHAPAIGIVNKSLAAEMRLPIDTRTGRPLGLSTVASELPGGEVRSLSASQDGSREAVVISRASLDIFVARVDDGFTLKDKTQVTHGVSDAYPHAWTPDGKVLFETRVNTRTAIFAAGPGSYEPTLIATMPFDLFRPQMSPDGRWILFMGGQNGRKRLYRVPAAGGKPVPVPMPVEGNIEDFRCPAREATACVASEPVGREAFAYYALDAVTGLGKELLRTPWRRARVGTWNLSPDGRTIAIADDSSIHPGVELLALPVEGARPDAARYVALPEHGTVLAPGWSADGKVLFVECRTGDGFTLIYHRLSGEKADGLIATSKNLIYAVPSPDGTRVALPLPSVTSNVWVATFDPR